VNNAVLITIALVGLGACAPQSTRRARTPRDLTEIDRIVRSAAARHQVDAALVRGVIQVESGFRPDARSSVGARGLMQLMPKTAASLARRLGWDSYDIEDPRFNVDAGTAYLAYLLERFDNDARLALAAYNTGPARVARWVRKGSSLPSYSRRYVRAVLAAASQLKSGPPTDTGALELDSAGLRQLLRARLYGTRADEEI
jgi:soluble lytic murein transglycosylase-like protein